MNSLSRAEVEDISFLPWGEPRLRRDRGVDEFVDVKLLLRS